MNTVIDKGRRVKLITPALTFEGIDPPPIDVDSEGIVVEIKGAGAGRVIMVDWDRGFVARHDESELAVVR